jgi:hypothetical protein
MSNRVGNYLKFICLVVGSAFLFQNCGAPQSNIKSSNGSSFGNNNGGGGGGSFDAPAAPSGLSAVSLSSASIKLTWVDNSNNETGFKVERYATSPFGGGGSFSAIATTSPGVTTYTDQLSLTPGTSYTYRVSAVNNTVSSSVTAPASATTSAAPSSPPSPPSALVATAAAATIVNLSWTDGSNNESYFNVERSTNGGGTFSALATVSADTTTYQDINLNPATSYVYRVRATNSAGSSNYTANGSVTTPAAGATNTFTYVNANIIGPNCVSCHSAAFAAGGVNLSGFNNVKNNASASLSDIQSGRMPPGQPLSATQTSQVKAWVDSGTPNN